MPAASEPLPAAEPPALPITWRPLGPRIVGIVTTIGLLVIIGVAWFGFDEETRAKFTTVQRGTLVGFGLLAGSVMHALTRSRVEAHRDRLVVVNGYRRREFAWQQIIAVHLRPGAPWASLDLADGETAAVMGIQGSDGERAKAAVRTLRALVAASSPPPD